MVGFLWGVALGFRLLALPAVWDLVFFIWHLFSPAKIAKVAKHSALSVLGGIFYSRKD
jgi:hypothetical protein